MSISSEVFDASRADAPRAGRRLQLTRAAQWFAGSQGDPLAELLRDTGGPEAAARLRAEGPVRHSPLLAAWATAEPAVIAEVLTSSAFDGLNPDGTRPRQAELPLAGPALAIDRATAARLAGFVHPGGSRTRSATEDDLATAAEAEFGARLDEAHEAGTALPGQGAKTIDLAAVARQAVARLLVAELGVPDIDAPEVVEAIGRTATAVDGTLVPAVLDDARACFTAQHRLGFLLAGPGEDRDAGRAALLLAVAAAEPAVALLISALERMRPGADVPAALERALVTTPPVRLEVRVAVEDVTLAGTRLPAGADVVLLMAGVAEDLWFGAAAPLVRAFARGGLSALVSRLPDPHVWCDPSSNSTPVRRRRSPVVQAHATYPLTTA